MPLWFLCDVDAEFEGLRLGYRPDPKLGEPGLTLGVPHLADFFHQYGVRATFHFQEQRDPQMSVLSQFPELYRVAHDKGHEVSLHVHIAKPDYATRKLEIGTGLERQRQAGYAPTTFRAGWYFTNTNTLRVLVELGLKYDCSPIKNLPVGPVSWYGIPDSPYHPSPRDIGRQGDSPVLVIPVTNRRLGIAIHHGSDEEFQTILQGVAALSSASQNMVAPVIIYFTTHSWKPIELNTAAFRDWEIRRRHQLFEAILKYPVRSLTVQEAGRLWIEGGYKPYHLRGLPDLAARRIPRSQVNHYLWLARWVVPWVTRIRYHLRGEV